MAREQRDRRWPRWVYGVGEEPDPRLTLANERTFLARIRTTLAALAGGVVLYVFATQLHSVLRLATSAILVAIGIVYAGTSWWHWARTERAMRLGKALPAPVMSIPVTLGVSVVGVLVLLMITVPW